MARPVSSVHSLPKEVRDSLHGWLQDPGVTQEEAAALVNEMLDRVAPDHPKISRKVVHRYDRRTRENMERVRKSQEVAKAWIANLGSQSGSDVGFMVIQTLKTLSLEASQQLMAGELDAESMPGVLDQLNKLALAAQRLERSAAESERRDRQIREEARRLAAEEAADKAAGAARSQGLSAETVAEIRKQVLGVAT